MLRQLAQFVFLRGYDSSNAKLAADPQSMATGSSNVLILGTGKNRIFKGFRQLFQSSLGNPPILGSRLGIIAGDAYAGLGRMADSSVIGSIFRVLGSIFFIGAGRLTYNGVDTGDDATTTLSIKRISSGALEATTYQAGLPQPSAPTIIAIDPPATFTGKNDGTVSVKIAKVRSATGARSIASPTSNVVVCKNQSVAITDIPTASSGQDYWEIDVTLNAYGGIGAHYFLQEVAESVIAATTTKAALLDSDDTIGVPNGSLGAVNIGWTAKTNQMESNTVVGTATGNGTATAIVTATGLSGSPRTVTASITNGDTPTTIAANLKTALEADIHINAMFQVVVSAGEIVLRHKNTTTLAALNLELAYTAAIGMTDDPTSTDVTLNTYVTDVGANDSHSSGNQTITLNTAAATSVDVDVKFTRAVNGIERSYVVEWRDADLAGADFAPIRDYPPPAGTHGGVSGDVVFVDGCYGENTNTVAQTSAITASSPGTAIAVSDPARPESFPPDNYLFTADPPTAVLEAAQGLHWRFGRNSLGVIRYIGGSPALSYETLWSGIGVVNQNNVTLGAGGRLYAYTGTRGICRLGPNGEPDVLFAARVSDDFAQWTNPAKVVLGYDANYGYVLFAYERTILCYYEALDVWCPPIVLPAGLHPGGEIKTMVTAAGAVYLAISNGSGAGDSIHAFAFDSPRTLSVTAATNASPIVITTSTDHLLATGETVAITGVGGNTNANGTWVVTRISSTTFSLNGSSGNAPYSSGGIVLPPGLVGKYVTQWTPSVTEFDIVSRIKLALRTDAPSTVTTKVYINGSATPTTTMTADVPDAGFRIPNTLRPNVRNARMWQIETSWASDTGEAGLEGIMVEGESSNILI